MRFTVDRELGRILRIHADSARDGYSVELFDDTPIVRVGADRYLTLSEFVIYRRDPRYRLLVETIPYVDDEKVEITHKNGKTNDCRLFNLEWTPLGRVGAMMRGYARRAPR